MSERDLASELARALEASAERPAGDPERPIVVAWSGGLDSTVLLDLVVRDVRVREAAAGRPIAAHLDHAMRPGSAEDARALAYTAAEWGVEFRTHRLDAAPASETEARTRRHAWLKTVADDTNAREIWMAHHADDQIETVLFHVLRGTGVAGLEGIPARRGRVLRPFLLCGEPVHRVDLSAHASARRLPVRIDPSNAEPVATRNRIRHEVLPLLEEVVPGAGDALLRLARNAERTSAEIDALVARVMENGRSAGASAGAGADVVSGRGAAPGLVDLGSADMWAGAARPLRRALLRGAARSMGVALSEAATLAALDLPADTQSGRGVDLPGGLRLEREFDRWRLARIDRDGGSDAPLRIARPRSARAGAVDATAGAADRPGASGSLVLGDRTLRADWWVGDGAGADLTFDLAPSAFPLTLRGWTEGDRITLDFGTTAVAKVWAEARVPRRERPLRWVLTDREGTVLAAEGLGPARSGDTIGGPSTKNPDPVVRLHLRLDAPA